MRETAGVRQWAALEFQHADLGDARRRRRVIAMAAAVARAPGGKISEVFRSAAERQGAYDFVESKHVDAKAMVEAVGRACAQRSACEPFVFVAVDGTGLSVVDHDRAKDLGAIGGSRGEETRGVKVVTALALDPGGVPIGIAAQRYWARPVRAAASRRVQKAESRRRTQQDKETEHWVEVVGDTSRRMRRAGGSPWFVIDREGDSQAILLRLHAKGTRFTVRSAHDRLVEDKSGHMTKLRQSLAKQAPLGVYEFEVPATHKRAARRARVCIRVAEVLLHMRIHDTRYVQLMPVTAVWAHEVGTAPGQDPLDWVLLTNTRAGTLDEARLVVFSYTMRWRIEEMHRAWKSSVCGIEQTQLRSHSAVTRWAILHAAVATRAERLKHRGRQQPDLPASVELDAHEIRALILLKRRHKKRTETVPDGVPTLAQATRWLADLGGYTGSRSAGPPGTITIERGLNHIRAAADVLRELDSPDDETNG